jgi:uncharacterized membrane protein
VRDAAPAERATEQWAERWISVLLRSGVITSFVAVVGGTLVSFLHHPEYRSSPAALARLTRPGQAFASLSDVATGVRLWHGQGIVMLGLLVLILTPILRVAFSIVIFAVERDRRFVTITSAVLLLLLVSFALGRAGG